MTAEVLALPAHGGLFFDARGADRALRVSRHDEAGVVVLSLWRDERCVGTCRLAADEVQALVETLSRQLPAAPEPIELPRVSPWPLDAPTVPPAPRSRARHARQRSAD